MPSLARRSVLPASALAVLAGTSVLVGNPQASAAGPLDLYAHTSPDIGLTDTVTDTAIVTNRTNPQAGGTVTFRLYGPNSVTCSGIPVLVETKPLPATSNAVASSPFMPLLPGTYRWVAHYSGDANNPAVTGSCNAAGQTVQVTLLAPKPYVCRGLEATFVGTPGADRLLGTPGSDVIVARSGDDTISAGGGNDTVCTGYGNDTADGGTGHDTLLGEAGRDTLRGNWGHDTVRGGDDTDTLYGGPGEDTMLGYDGADVVRGGAGNDDLDGGEGPDALRGETGRDHCAGGLGRDVVLTCERVD